MFQQFQCLLGFPNLENESALLGGKTLLAFALLHSVLQDQICLLLQVFLLCLEMNLFCLSSSLL